MRVGHKQVGGGERQGKGTFNGNDLGQERGVVGLGWNLDGFGRNGC